MSFEDDMIEEGFYQEQDYLDYLCSEADKRIDLFDSENEGEDAEFFDTFDSDKKNEDTGFAEYKSHNKEAVNPLVHSLQEWKKRDSDEVHFWNLIWETFIRKEYYRREGDRYFHSCSLNPFHGNHGLRAFIHINPGKMSTKKN